MDVSKLKILIENSGLSKQSIAEGCSISRPTLDNVLGGSDAKISTIENLSAFFKVPVGHFFDADVVNQSFDGNSNIVVGHDNNVNISVSECQNKLNDALLEIKHLKSLIENKDKLLDEKERLINVLMNR
ncbi:XRE family transcriptional regulator [Bacteroides reticulotermitis]|uniref:XRE family transcriptional regulator n=1 Tax=Bacteroides reticulotermitis TaxID=1133319 RepID=UPI003A88D452